MSPFPVKVKKKRKYSEIKRKRTEINKKQTKPLFLAGPPV